MLNNKDDIELYVSFIIGNTVLSMVKLDLNIDKKNIITQLELMISDNSSLPEEMILAIITAIRRLKTTPVIPVLK
jgi:hypothetical protein